MKSFIYFLFVAAAFMVASCSDSSNPVTSNSTPPPSCIKFDTLCSPPYDTIYYEYALARFIWRKASCDPVYYKLELCLSHTSDTLFIRPLHTYLVGTDTTLLEMYNAAPADTIYWRVKAFYGSPVTDSFTTAPYRFRVLSP